MSRLIFGIVTVALLSGCSDADAARPKGDALETAARQSLTYDQLATNDVIIRVNGAELTKGEVERQVEIRVALARIRQGKALDARKESRMRRDMRSTCEQQFLMQELMMAYALSNGVTVTEADRAARRDKLVKTYFRGGSYRQLEQRLSTEERRILAQGIDRELLTEKGRERLVADNLEPVTEEEVAKRREYFVNYNVMAKEALAKTWSDASNVWKKATGGYPFEKLVAQYADGDVEHISAEAEWGDLKASDFRDDKGLYQVLTNTPEGAIPPPFEGDNGVMVIKMLSITPANLADGQPEALYRLSRIHFELPEIWANQTDDELRAELTILHGRAAFSKGLKALSQAAKVECPCGKVLYSTPAAKGRPPIPAPVRSHIPRNINLPDEPTK